MLGRRCAARAVVLRPPGAPCAAACSSAAWRFSIPCRALPRCYATDSAGGDSSEARAGKIKTNIFADGLGDDAGKLNRARGRHSDNHPVNKRLREEQGLYRDPPPPEENPPKSAQQVRLLAAGATFSARCSHSDVLHNT